MNTNMDTIFDTKVKDCIFVLEKNLSDKLTFECMLSIIETSPPKIHDELMIEFTYLYGQYKGLPKEIIDNEMKFVNKN